MIIEKWLTFYWATLYKYSVWFFCKFRANEYTGERILLHRRSNVVKFMTNSIVAYFHWHHLKSHASWKRIPLTHIKLIAVSDVIGK